ncbi:hypothetical protein RCT11_09335 [Escherichia marmotae]|nr:hypothetical protein [Escherichia marmotae]
MGDWGKKPWDNDAAADWFHRFWSGTDKSNFEFLISEINNFNPDTDRYDAVRAACYILQTIGIPHVWPVKHLDILKEILEKALLILTNMINPPNDKWLFLEDCDDEMLHAVNEQITAIKLRLEELA